MAFMLLFGVNPLRRSRRIALTENILKEKRRQITKHRIKRREHALIRLETLLKRSGYTKERFIVLVVVAFIIGSGVGYALFDGLMLSIATGIAFLPAPYLYITVKAQGNARREVESLENTMSIITNAYIGCDDIVRAVERTVREKNQYVPDELRAITPFDEFVSEIILINPNVERGLQILAAKINNTYFSQWIKMLILCHQDRRLKFALAPVIDAMNDAKGMQLESDTQMARTWRDYFLTVGLMFGIIPILRVSNAAWFAILTQTFFGKALIILMLVMTFVTSFFVMRINKPITTI